MIYSRATRYAIQALVYLASNPDEYHTAQEIAEEREIPEHFLAKILKDLVKEGMLESQKGRGGGFKLALPPEEIMLLNVMDSVEGLDPIYSCIFGDSIAKVLNSQVEAVRNLELLHKSFSGL